MEIKSTLAVCFTAVLLVMSYFSRAQVAELSTVDLRFANAVADCEADPAQLCVDIQIKASEGAPDFAIGSHTIWFSYDKSVVNNPVYNSVEFNDDTQCTLAGGGTSSPYLAANFSFDDNTDPRGQANVTTISPGPQTAGSECPVISTSWITVGNICFDIVNSAGSADLRFDSGLTIFNKSDNNPEHDLGVLNPADIAVSVGAGTPEIAKTVVCWNDDVVYSVDGYTLGDERDGYIGLVVSEDSNLTSLAGQQVLALDAAESVTYGNGGSPFPVNTELYVYSFVGAGDIGNFSLDCTDMQRAEGTFVALGEILINNGTEEATYDNCDGDNAEVQLQVTGGLPAYDGSTFGVAVDGATYTGNAEVADGETITITVTDGQTYTVTFTDGQGCSAEFRGTFDKTRDCECSVVVVGATPLTCNGDGTYDLEVEVMYSTAPTSTININSEPFTIDGSGNETFTLTNLTGDGASDQDVIAALATDCGYTFTAAYDAPDCSNDSGGNGDACILTDVQLVLGPCDDNGEFPIAINSYSGSNLGTTFTVTVNGSSAYGPYDYADITNGVFIDRFPGDGEALSVTIIDGTDSDCTFYASTGLFAPTCDTNNNPCTVDGGSISTSDPVEFCVGDGEADNVTVSISDNVGTELGYLITDENGIILSDGIQPGPTFNFEDAGEGVCLIWAIAYEDINDLTNVAQSDNASDITGCHALSNSIAVTRTTCEPVCDVAGGTLSTASAVEVCVGDGEADNVTVSISDNTGTELGYLITDENGVILSDGIQAGPTFDFEGAGTGICLIWAIAYNDINDLGNVAQSDNASDITGCHSLSTNSVAVNRITCEPTCDVAGGTITTMSTLEVCVGDGEADNVTVNISDNTGTELGYLITDENGIILSDGIQTGPTFDFEGAGTGVCLIWAIAYEDINDLGNVAQSDNATDITGCHALSNSIAVNRITCEPSCDVAGGTLSTASAVEVCVGDGEADNVTVSVSDNMGTELGYLITDENGVILSDGIQAGPTFDFEGAGTGVCLIWAIAYEDINDLGNVAQSDNASDITGCHSISTNSVAVNRIICEPACDVAGGSITTSDPIEVCVGDGEDDNVTVSISGNMGTELGYLITDQNGLILSDGIQTGPTFNFEGAGEGVCLIWAIAYDDINDLGNVAQSDNATQITGCHSLSNSIAVTRMICTDPVDPNPGDSFACGEQNLVSCVCDGLGELIVDSEPCDINSAFSVRYLLVDVMNASVSGDDDDNIIDQVSTTGTFSNVPQGDYLIYYFYYSNDDATILESFTEPGDPIADIIDLGVEMGPGIWTSNAPVFELIASSLATVNAAACGCDDPPGDVFVCGNQTLTDCQCEGTGVLVADSNPCDVNSASSQLFVLVDAMDATVDGDDDDGLIDQINTNGTFTNVPTGDYLIYYIIYDNSNALTVEGLVDVGDPISDILALGTEGPIGMWTSDNPGFEIMVSSLATINADACNCGEDPDPDVFVCGSQDLEVCVCGDTGDLVADSEPCAVNSATKQAYVLVDVMNSLVDGDLDNNQIVQFSTTGTFTDVPAGDYLIYYVNYGMSSALAVESLLEVGDDIATILGLGTEVMAGNWTSDSPEFDILVSSLATVNAPSCGCVNCDDFDITLTPSDATCTENGSVCVSFTGGAPSYQLTSDAGIGGAFTGSDECFEDVPPGDYYIEVQDDEGCTVRKDFSIAAPTNCGTDCENLSLDYLTTNATCTSGGSVCLTASGGTAPYQLISAVGIGGFLSEGQQKCYGNLAPDTYTVQAEDANGCKVGVTFTINPATDCGGDCEDVVVSLTVEDASCTAGGEVCFNFTGGAAPYSLQSDASGVGGSFMEGTDACFTEVNPGSYAATITDANGCEINRTFVITTPENCEVDCTTLAINATAGDADCDTEQAEVCFSFEGGHPPYQLISGITGVSGTFDEGDTPCFDMPPGAYTVQVKDSEDCERNTSFTINTPTNCGGECDNFVVTSTTNDETCEGGKGGVCFTFTGGTAPYNIVSGFIATTDDYAENEEVCFADINAGTYSVTVEDANGCMQEKTFIINEATNCPDPCDSFVVSATTTDENCDGTKGNVCFTFTGGTAPYNIVSGFIATTDDYDENTEVCFDELNPGTYQVTVRDSRGCTRTTSFSVGEAENCGGTCEDMIVSTETMDEMCDGTAGYVCMTFSGGTAPYNIITGIAGVSGGNYAEGQEACFEGLPAGNYAVKVRDANDCEINKSFTINEASNCGVGCTNMMVDISVTDATCTVNTGAICITVSGANAPYSIISGIAGINDSFEEGVARCYDGLPAGDYIIKVRDAEGCEVNQAFTIDAPTDCGGSCDDMTVAVDVTNATCTTTTGSICVTVSGANAPYNIVSGIAGITDDFAEGVERCYDELPAGDYVIKVRDADGCEVNRSFTILPASNCGGGCDDMTVSVDVTNATCTTTTGAICVTVSGANAPYNIVSGIAGIADDFAEGVARCYDELPAGDYVIKVRDADGCEVNRSFTILPASNCGGACDNMTVSVNVTDATCNEFGAVCIAASGGTAPYTIISGIAGITDQFSEGSARCYDDLPSGSYIIKMRDAEGCEVNQSFIIGTATGCGGNCDGFTLSLSTQQTGDCEIVESVCVAPQGGTAPYTWAADNGSTGSIATGGQDCFSIPGTYVVTITDANNCKKVGSITVQPSTTTAFDVNVIVSDADCDGNNGTACLTITGGTGPYTVRSADGSTNFGTFSQGVQKCVNNLSNGAYVMQITDAEGCSQITNVIILKETNCGILANDDYFNGEPGENIVLDLTSNDFGDGAVIISFDQPHGGTIIRNDDGTLTFVPDEGFSGTTTFTYTIEVDGVQSTATVTIFVEGDPQPCDDSNNPTHVCTQPSTSIVVCVEFCEVPGAVLTEAHPTFDCGIEYLGNNCIRYTPLPAQTGVDIIEMIGCNDAGQCQTIYVNVTIGDDCGIDPPDPTCDDSDNPTQLCTKPVTPVQFCLDFCDLDATAQITDLHTTFDCGLENLGNGCVRYTPLPGYLGNDVIEVTACDNSGSCQTISVSVVVTEGGDCGIDPPNPCDDSDNPTQLCTKPVTPVQFCLDFCQLNGSAAITELHTTFDCGLEDLGNGCVQYTPLPGYLGNDVIEVTACDNTGACQTINVPVEVTEGECGTPPNPCDDSDNPTQLCTKPITPVEFCLDFCQLNETAMIESLSTTFDCGLEDLGNGCVKYTPLPGYLGNDVIVVVACDNTGACQTINVAVEVTEGECGTPPNPCNDTDNPTQLCTKPITPVQFCLEFCELNETAAIQDISTTFDCGLEDLGNNCVQYTPLPGYLGNDVVVVTACDNTGACQTINVAVEVTEGECNQTEPIVAVPDVVTTNQGETVCVDILANDFAANGGNIFVSNFMQPANGVVTVSDDGQLCYTPNEGFTGTDSFEYTVCDEQGNCASTTVTINVIGDIPECNNPTDVCTGLMEAVVICVDFCDLDDSATVTAAHTTFDCGLQIFEDGSNCIQYTPLPGFDGSDVIEIIGCDNTGACDTIFVNVYVGEEYCPDGDNTAPIVGNDSASTNEGEPVTICILDNDSDPDGNSLMITALGSPANGTVTFNADSTCIVYTPNPGFSGTDIFNYQVCDDGQPPLCSEGTVSVTVLDDCANDLPTWICAEPLLPATICPEFCELKDTEGLDIESVEATFNCSITILDNNCFQYTPLPGYEGMDSLTVIACNLAGECEEVVVYSFVGCAPPRAIDDIFNAPNGEFASFNVMDNDMGICSEFSEMIVTVTNGPAHGTVSIDENGNVVYISEAGYVGQDTFTYTVCDPCDPEGACDEAVVVINVGGETAPIDAQPDIAYTPFNTPVNIPILSNDVNGGVNISVTNFTQGENGTVTVGPDGTLTYTPNDGFIGVDYFSYTICNEFNVCDETIVSVTVLDPNMPNMPPMAGNDVVETNPDTPIDIPVLGNDSDPEGGTMTVVDVVQEPTMGTVVINDDGTITYTPNPGVTDTVDVFTYVVCDDGEPVACDTAMVGVAIGTTFPNNPPVAVSDTTTTPPSVPVVIDILGNDFDPDGDNLFAEIITEPMHGDVEFTDDGQVLYTPEEGFEGQDHFMYILCDDGAMVPLCDTTFVVIIVSDDPINGVNLPPVAGTDTVFTNVNTPISLNIPGISSDPNGDPLTCHVIQEPVNGELLYNPTDSCDILYSPNLGSEEGDTIVYVVCDPFGLCDTAEIYIVVTNPLVVNPDHVFVEEDGTVTIPVLDNDSGCDLEITGVSGAENGTVSVNLDGTITYTPNDGFVGDDYFTYEVCDCTGECGTSLVGVTVYPEGFNFPPVGVNDQYTTPVDSTIVMPVLDNDVDPNGDELIIVDVSDPENGTVVIGPDSTTVIYTPNLGFEGCDLFYYVVCETENRTSCDTAYVGVGVGTTECLNIPPIAVNDTTETPPSTPVTINVLGNDSDPDGPQDQLCTEPLSNPAHGTITATDDCNFIYTPDEGYIGEDYFLYLLCDEGPYPPLCDTALVVITIRTDTGSGTDDLDAEPDIAYTPVNMPVNIPVLDNDGGEGLEVTQIVSGPENGTATINPNGTITYTPDPEFVGTDYFEYEVCDESGNCAITLVTVHVMPDSIENVKPNAVNDMAETEPNTPVTIDVLGNDNDPFCGDQLQITEVFQPEDCGIVEFTEDGSQLIFTPAEDFTGVCSFSYLVCDNCPDTILCDTAIVAVGVGTGIPNNFPTAVDDEDSTPQDTPITLDILDNDFDPDNDDLTITFISEPENGDVVMNEDGTITYTPDPGYTGDDFFVYIVCDEGMPPLCDTAYVTIHVLPDSIDVFDTIPEDGQQVFCPEGDTTIASIDFIDLPENGELIQDQESDSCIVYIPNDDFCGMDAYTIAVCDVLGVCDTLTIGIEVLCTPDPPVAVDDRDTTALNTPVTINVLDNDYDPDGDPITVIEIIEDPMNGTAFIDENDSTITYVPNTGFLGTDTFTYVICDDTAPEPLCDTAEVIVVVGVANAVDAVDDRESTELNTPVDIPILDNDNYPAGDITVEITTQPVEGGTVVVNADDPENVTVTYTPADGFVGLDSFEYVLCVDIIDIDTTLCDTAWVVVDVTAGCDLRFPSGISPNADGVNDEFNILGVTGCLDDNEPELLIFNRWGDLVYKIHNYTNINDRWDGTYITTGKPVPDGTYFYILWWKENGEEKDERGWVEVRR